jgi:hypothetical protein
VYESQVQSVSLTPQVVPWQLCPVKTDAQSDVRASQSSWCWSWGHAGVPSHAAIVRHWPVKQPSLTSATWLSGQAGGGVVQLTAARHIPAGSAPVMHVLRVSSHQAKPALIASASLVQVQVAWHAPLLVSHIDPVAHCASPVHWGLGMHDDRAVSQWKPGPQSVSVPQNPPSVHTPPEQKQPAEHWVSMVH